MEPACRLSLSGFHLRLGLNPNSEVERYPWNLLISQEKDGFKTIASEFGLNTALRHKSGKMLERPVIGAFGVCGEKACRDLPAL